MLSEPVPAPSGAAVARASDPARAANQLIAAAERLRDLLVRGVRIDARLLRTAMTDAFDGSDAEGFWTWKQAYEAGEVALILFLRRFGGTMWQAPLDQRLSMLDRLSGLLPSHTRRSEESQALQQFSTPLALGQTVAAAAQFRGDDVVLEPSAGTGLLAILAELAGASLVLNELGDTRVAMLRRLFPAAAVGRVDAAYIHDHLNRGVVPSVVVMNPPFSVAAEVDGRVPDAVYRHIASALRRVAKGGRLVAITPARFSPDNPAWADAFARLGELGTVLFTAAISGRTYARHGTTTETRLTVIDRIVDAAAAAPTCLGMADDAATLLGWIEQHVPPRARAAGARTITPIDRGPHGVDHAASKPCARSLAPIAADAVELAYAPLEGRAGEDARISDALYEPYSLQTIRIPGAQPHPTPLVQSAAMASVPPPCPSYRPHLPKGLVDAGLLSDAQLETVILAGEAHSGLLAGAWIVDGTWDRIAAAPDDAADAVRFRRGFMLGDGTGAGKGRQVAGIILDNWLKGRRRALWISKSDTLIEDAQRDWSALGQERLLVQPLSRFRQGSPIRLDQGILFATYATLRSDARDGKPSRLEQIIDWLGMDFDGLIVFDESHAMQNAGGSRSERGDAAPSQQGRAGLRLQHARADARVLYVSATGATTVQNLAYAQRLGLWGGEDFPFASRAEFVAAIETGGVAAMEVLARDLKALGLYTARSLSYAGVEYEIVEHALTPEQTRIYDTYAGAFQIIHHNLDAALEATGVTAQAGDGGSRTLNAQAKSAARSAFESAKQRFFGHLLTSMKTPTLIARIDEDLAAGHACVIQIVSTGEALMERRLADIPSEEWGDVQVDITPREYVLDYLAYAFPVELFEPFTDSEGNLCSRAVRDEDGQPVLSREAIERRDALIERLASLPPVQGALDQIVQRFGTDQVAEVTGRSRRIVRKRGEDGVERLALENRPVGTNLAETAAFQDDKKRILVFSEAGGTGRSYHADLSARNQRLRVHYLLEAGWKADAAIQGLGRTNRTHQARPPVFRPIATDVRGEKRFLSTIARRLDTLGAITRGQRQTGGQGLFRASDNLESPYARATLRQLYMLLLGGKVEGCSLGRFEQATGLTLTTRDGATKEELPPITQFLNRVLALPIALQNLLFEVFDRLLDTRVEAAVEAGTYDAGVETLRAASLVIADRRTIYTHPGTGAETRVFDIVRRDRTEALPLEDALDLAAKRKARLLVNTRSERAAVALPAASITLDDGEVEPRVRLVRPTERRNMAMSALAGSHWEAADQAAFGAAWDAEIGGLPEFIESRLHIVTGLLLPIWRRLPEDGCCVYRLQTDDGERVIGRRVSPQWVADILQDDRPAIAADDAWNAVLARGATLQLEGAMTIRRSLVMGVQRVEFCGFSDAMVERLKAMGLMSEIIAWKLRLFVPTGADGPVILAKLLDRHPLQRVIDRPAA